MFRVKELHDLCLQNNISIAVAESCTSGRIASLLTSIPDSSSFFKGGVIAYQNEIKINVLKVSADLINEKTEVSPEVVTEMARNVLLYFGSNFAIATSGYAGPGGGSLECPIGTVYIAIANKSNVDVKKCFFSGNRDSIVKQATIKSLEYLFYEVKKNQ